MAGPKRKERISDSKGDDPAGASAEELQDLVHELKTHQEELHAQQVQLLETQRALESARDRYEELFDFAPIGYVSLDASGMIREANLAAANLVGIERTSLIGRPLLMQVIESQRREVLDHMTRCRLGNGRVETEVMLRSAGGVHLPVQLASASVRRDDRVLFLTALIDLSETKRMEQERSRIREVQTRMQLNEQMARTANDAKDRFLAMLSHELRTPLTPILLGLDTIQRRGPVPEGIQTTLDMIHRNITLETRLIDDLLDVSRIVQGKMTFLPEVVDVHEVIHDVFHMLEGDLRKAELTVSLDLRAAARHVKIDPVRLRQVLWNLLLNAMRNTPAGGQVSISTSNDGLQQITIEVQDNGRGIDPKMLARIFNLFEQDEDLRRRGLGLGLGLPISKTIVEAHGGHIGVRSDGRYHGTQVQVDLPTVAEPVTDDAPVARDRAVPVAARRVLLVEDNADSATALAEILGMSGYQVRVAGSVQEALLLLDDVDIVISDIGLPDGTGHELMRKICARRWLPGIALSGYGTAEDVRRSAEAGFERHIVKPVEPQSLLDALESLSAVKHERQVG